MNRLPQGRFTSPRTSGDPAFTGAVLAAVFADTENYFTGPAFRLLLQIAVIAIRFIRIFAVCIRAGDHLISLVPALELLIADITIGIEA